MAKIKINSKKIAECRKLAHKIAYEIQKTINRNTTVSIERSILRLFGLDGIDSYGAPYPNIVVDKLKVSGLLQHGAANVISYMMLKHKKDFNTICRLLVQKKIEPEYNEKESSKVRQAADALCRYGILRIEKARIERNKIKKRYPVSESNPWLYVIVATGNIHEDVKQARSAALNGANCIAVIRSTAQSLMDYVPYGATTEGFGGTYATQENFRIMRKALDELTPKLKRYVYLINYCSGLCMSEIAAMGAMERLDMMLNDSMYGIIFRDINMVRTFIDQYFSRIILTQADIIINTGEDNYLTTSDAMSQYNTVLVSHFINEQFAKNAGMPERLMGLGHAFQINPDIRNSFLYEIAQAQLLRQVFPKHPLKYMPPTKYITGDIFKAQEINTMFSLASVTTGQFIHLVGMLTEGIHTPFIQDRYLSVENSKYVFNAARDLSSEIEFKQGGIIQKRADKIIDETLVMLKDINKIGLVKAIERGYFANIKRSQTGGKGLEGVIEKSKDYYNPFEEKWSK